MAANNNIGDLLTDVANALRAKGGTTGSINAQNFATAIAELPSGGGGLVSGSYIISSSINLDGTQTLNIINNVSPSVLDNTVTFMSGSDKYYVAGCISGNAISAPPPVFSHNISGWKDGNNNRVYFPYTPTGITETLYAISFSDIYQPVEYIEVTGTQWITIWGDEYTVTVGDIIDLDYELLVNSGEQAIVGTDGVIEMYTSGGATVLFWGGISNSESTTQTLPLNTRKHIKGTFTRTPAYFHIFNYGADKAKYICAGGRLYGCKICSSDSVVLDLIPCYRRSDSVAGVYNASTGTFLTNAGTGTFIVGPDVN